MNEADSVVQQVKEFYDAVGWIEVSDGVYQNAHYEDLRPVSREYIHNAHLRILRHLSSKGKYLLDAGSGPIQYPEYLEYSAEYQKRVCVDISITALKEARKRIKEHGLYVIADVSKLPFKSEVFDGVVSLHTIHHLPIELHELAYESIYSVLKPGKTAVVVNGWGNSPITNVLKWGIKLIRNRKNNQEISEEEISNDKVGTFVNKNNPKWIKQNLKNFRKVKIYVWRSLPVVGMRFFVREKYAGRWILKIVYSIEEVFPQLLGKYGAYPMVVIWK